MRKLLTTGLVTVALGSARAQITNGDFEATPFNAGWQNAGALVTEGFALGSTQAARFTGIGQFLRQPVIWGAEWHLDYWFMVKPGPGRQFSLILETGGSVTAVNLRYEAGWFAFAGAWGSPLALGAVTPSVDGNNDGDLDDAGDTKNVYHMRVTGHDWGTAGARYDLQLSDANGSAFTSTVTGLARYQGGTPTATTPSGFKFGTEFGNNPGFWLDDVSSHEDTPPGATPAISYFVADGTTLTWQTSNALSLTLDPGAIDVTGLTSYAVSPVATQAYTLTATADAGSVSKSFTLGVGETVAPLAINEFLAINPVGEDWIELHNPNAFSLNLDEWALTDTPANPAQRVFPPGAIDPGGYVVLTATEVGFSLDGDGEYLALVDPEGNVAGAFDPGFPAQYAGVSYGAQPGGGFGYFGAPTPGAINTPSPFVTNHAGTAQQDGSVLVSVTTGSSAGPLASVELVYRAMYAAERTLAMADQGNGTFAATIPAGTAAPGEMLRWRVVARDTGNIIAKLPPFASATTSPEYFGTVIADPAVTGTLPVLHWFQPPGAPSETRTGNRCALFWNGEFHDNVLVHLRGATTAGLEKKPHQFEFNPGHGFRIADGLPRVDQVNVNAAYPDASYLRDILPMENLRTMGMPTPETFAIRVQRNGTFHSLGILIEQPDGEFLRRHDEILDPEGPLYKATGNGTWLASATGFEARNGASLADLSNFAAALNGPNQLDFLLENVDLPSLVNYLAVNVVDSIFNPQKNYYVHRNRFGEWMILPWDRDFSYGHRWLGGGDPRGPAGPTGFLVADERYEWGGSDHDFKGGYNRLFNAVYAHPLTSEMFYRRLRSVMDTLLAPGVIETRIEELRALMGETADLDRATWGFTNDGSYRNFPQESFDAALDRIKTDYLPARRAFLENDGGTPARGLLPPSQPNAPSVVFGDVVFNPASGNQDEESIELRNPNAFAVDVSGWRIEGGVEHALRAGTVIPAATSLYLSPRVEVFRAANAPLFAQGNYRGHLSNFGETLTLLDRNGTTVATVTTEAMPGANQLYLGISEVMYHPAGDPDLEFVELVNASDSVTLDLSGVAFTAGFEYVFPSGTTLPPGERITIAYADFTAGRLSNSGETIKVEDADGSTIVEFTYSDGAPWPSEADGGGPSLVFVGGDARLPESWRASLVAGGNPGATDRVPFAGGDLLAYALAGEVEFHAETMSLGLERRPGTDDAMVRPQWSADLHTWHESSFTYLGGDKWLYDFTPSPHALFLRFHVSLR